MRLAVRSHGAAQVDRAAAQAFDLDHPVARACCEPQIARDRRVAPDEVHPVRFEHTGREARRGPERELEIAYLDRRALRGAQLDGIARERGEQRRERGVLRAQRLHPHARLLPREQPRRAIDREARARDRDLRARLSVRRNARVAREQPADRVGDARLEAAVDRERDLLPELARKLDARLPLRLRGLGQSGEEVVQLDALDGELPRALAAGIRGHAQMSVRLRAGARDLRFQCDVEVFAADPGRRDRADDRAGVGHSEAQQGSLGRELVDQDRRAARLVPTRISARLLDMRCHAPPLRLELLARRGQRDRGLDQVDPGDLDPPAQQREQVREDVEPRGDGVEIARADRDVARREARHRVPGELEHVDRHREAGVIGECGFDSRAVLVDVDCSLGDLPRDRAEQERDHAAPEQPTPDRTVPRLVGHVGGRPPASV